MPHQDHDALRLRASRDSVQALVKPLLIGLALALLAFAFARLGSEVIEGDTLSFDAYVLRGAQSLRINHPWLAEIMRDLSGLGSTVALTLFTLATTGYLALFSARGTALVVASSVISGSMLVSVFKAMFGRVRPGAAFAEILVPGWSFPSGHASMSAIVFLTVGALVASSRKRVNERSYILGVAVLMTLLVGLSRVGLGVHWATDVLGGWAFGTAWAVGCLLVARRLGPR